MKDNCVVFKGRKEGILVMLSDNYEFSYIRDTLKQKVKDAKKFFGGTKTAIAFSGRTLNKDETTELIKIIRDECELEISYVEGDGFPINESNNKLSAEDNMRSKISAQENYTIYHKGSIRSGQAIKYSGSVVVIGDVNPGGEIIAEGNIIVLGALKGLAHAGCGGNTDCIIAALILTPTQIRIGDILSYVSFDKSRKGKMLPSQAFVDEGQIFIAPL